MSDAIDTKVDYCVTPGWASMRFAKPLLPNGRYRSYVKMIPDVNDATQYYGDVYILQSGSIIGVVKRIHFRRYPRILLNHFFSAPDAATKSGRTVAQNASSASKAHQSDFAVTAAVATDAREPLVKEVQLRVAPVETVGPQKVSAPPAAQPDHVPVPDAITTTTSTKAMQLIADEAGLNVADLADDASFANFGVDSLMSLVIAEKFREQLGIVVSGSLFLEYPTIKDLRIWLEEYAD